MEQESTLTRIQKAREEVVREFKIACVLAGITQADIAEKAGKSPTDVYHTVRGIRRVPEVVEALWELLPRFAEAHVGRQI